MHFTDLTITALSLLAAQASARTIRIAVGRDGLAFSPSSVTAEEGDVLEYHFYKQHSVAMGDFSSGCTPALQGGFFSGVMKTSGNGPNKNVFRVTVNSTEPMAMYCTVASHCQKGMVGVVNPTSTDSLDRYKTAARAAQANEAPDGMFGGEMVEGNDNTDGGSRTSPYRPTGIASGDRATITGAASQMQASLGVVGAVAVGFAALLI
ncbi:hypothetical protein C2857_002623 [Epichloe festucae Fl1]|uniref:Extracellular serine-rich protein n=1 Tax=Epichloe festucae (strain Fl1) TaxID=877507 RepID=A0A7U3Q2T3_EPIFF|nr:hypothetical protein C2857_002623 [Epichloe festucae Fl1]